MPLAPLVEPAAALPPGEAERAARQLRLLQVGDVGQRRIRAARVGVLGAGGLGSPVLLYLASAGIGTIGIVDDDVVDASNLQRQIIFSVDDVGRPKGSVAADRIRSISPHTTVVEHREHLTPENAEQIFADYDLIIDGSDTFSTRYAVADACAALGIPLVWGSVLQFDAQATVFWSTPSSGQPVTLRDVFPVAPAPGEVPSCAEAGVLGALCGQLGGILVTEAVKLICGIGESLLGRMLVLDGLGARTREVPLVATMPPTDWVPDGGSPDAATGARPAHVALSDLESLAPETLLDVREPEEFARGTIPGAVSVPLSEVLSDAASVPLAGTVVVFCQQGPRARAAAHALTAAHPSADIRLLEGGYADWTEWSRA